MRSETKMRGGYRVLESSRRLAAVFGGVWLLSSAGAFGQTPSKITASDGKQFDQFGSSVSVFATQIAVGVWSKDHPRQAGLEAGAVYVYQRNGSSWVEQAKLVATSASENDRLGWSLSLGGTRIAVGAPSIHFLDTSSAAYIYRQEGSTWVQEARLNRASPKTGDGFGYSVSLRADEGLVVVGAPFDDAPTGADAGSAYVFHYLEEGGWAEQAKLRADDAAAGDLFGTSASIHVDRIVVGAPLADTSVADDAGAAYIFRREGGNWVQEAKLRADDAAAGDLFGASVCIDDDRVVVGAPRSETPTVADAGSSYVFQRDGRNWVQVTKLTANDAGPGHILELADGFGLSVSLSGNRVVVGARGADTAAGRDAGAAYIFRQEGTRWVLQTKLTADDAANSHWFGSSVSVDADVVLVGAPGAKGPAGDDAVGAAYVFVYP